MVSYSMESQQHVLRVERWAMTSGSEMISMILTECHTHSVQCISIGLHSSPPPCANYAKVANQYGPFTDSSWTRA